MLKLLSKIKFNVYIPLPFVSCGVIGMSFSKVRVDAGKIATSLLKRLEYRGYDSTGVVVQDDKHKTILRKGVGAPSKLTKSLGMYKMKGKLFCGQVRWATYGSVNYANTQPHEVRCFTHIYGAHNGNISNCDELKVWLTKLGHKIQSDNDGEMLVHTIEHFFHKNLQKVGKGGLKIRDECMCNAICEAAAKFKGSYAAVIVDPITERLYAIKNGSSLYVGVGKDNKGKYIIASSDLSAVLSVTSFLVDIKDGEFIEFVSDKYEMYSIKEVINGKTTFTAIKRRPKKTALSSTDIELKKPYKYFMEQEIAEQPEMIKNVLNKYLNDEDYKQTINGFVKLLLQTEENGGKIHLISCGTSYHSSLMASLIFNTVVNMSAIPSLPGQFRSCYLNSLDENDIIIGISQSGETKDLIDIFDYVKQKYPEVKRLSLVNNVNSSMALIKSDLCVPLYCGMEIAVPATKSFINQLMVFFILAHALLKKKTKDKKYVALRKFVDVREKQLKILPGLVRKTIKSTVIDVERVAKKIYLEPSIHILGTGILGIAKEGALKIREVVLNHTEGIEGREFKHGPNTILGVNTIFGPSDIARVVELSGGDKKSLFSELTNKNYPLIYICGPHPLDVELTVSQLNTHKIRGASPFVIAEENKLLRQAAMKRPAELANYDWDYISTPKTGDKVLSCFCIAVVLQMLALKMSLLKKDYLDKLGLNNHGVHPDVPKNVSKSITVV